MIMIDYPLHSLDTAPEAARPILAAAQASWGFVPNLLAVLAEAPAALEGYTTLFRLFDGSSFSPIERQVVYLTVNFENDCHYCMAGHSVLARMAGMAPADIEALRNGLPLVNARLEALHHFTAAMVRQRGFIPGAEIDAFLAAGFSKAQVLEVILGIATKVLSNYTNHIAATPLDPFMTGAEWSRPARAVA
jgi:uncharacterized peroxidase-related enzyme